MTAKAAGGQPERLTPVPSTVSLPDSSTGSSSLPSSSTSPNSVRSVSTGGSQQNDQTKTSVPSTVSLPVNSTILSAGVGQQSNDQTEKSSLNVGAIVGSVIGGLAFLAAVGVGAWIFRRKKAVGEEIGRDNLQVGDVRCSSDIVTHEHDMQPPEMRFYVRFFILLPNLFSDLRR